MGEVFDESKAVWLSHLGEKSQSLDWQQNSERISSLLKPPSTNSKNFRWQMPVDPILDLRNLRVLSNSTVGMNGKCGCNVATEDSYAAYVHPGEQYSTLYSNRHGGSFYTTKILGTERAGNPSTPPVPVDLRSFPTKLVTITTRRAMSSSNVQTREIPLSIVVGAGSMDPLLNNWMRRTAVFHQRNISSLLDALSVPSKEAPIKWSKPRFAWTLRWNCCALETGTSTSTCAMWSRIQWAETWLT